MKKVMIVLLLAVVLPFSAKAYSPYGGYSDVTVDLTARGGYNFFENTPLVSGAVGLDFWGVRAELELGWTQLNIPESLAKKDLCIVSPMIGYTYGYSHKLYAMVGVSTWGYTEVSGKSGQNYSWHNSLCGKVKVGANMYMTNNFFINVDVSYLIPVSSKTPSIDYRGFNTCVGVGYRF